MAQSTVRLVVDAQNAIRGLTATDRVTKTLAGNTNKLKNRNSIKQFLYLAVYMNGEKFMEKLVVILQSG